MPRQRCLQQPLRDQIRISPIRRCGMGVILDGETEVAGGTAFRKLDDVFTGAISFVPGRERSGKRRGSAAFGGIRNLFRALGWGFWGKGEPRAGRRWKR